jgi:Protein of unknown function (DUF3141)
MSTTLRADLSAADRVARRIDVFDPRAGQGPGIGEMKRDSEIGADILDIGAATVFLC